MTDDDQSEKNAERIFGPDYAVLIQKSVEHGLDWKGHVDALVEQIKRRESNIELDMGDFQRSLDPAWWPCIAEALDLATLYENARRTMISLIETGLLTGRVQYAVVDIVSGAQDATKKFIDATLTGLLGQTFAGWPDDEISEKLIQPYNNIMNQRRAIYDMLGEANTAYATRLLEAMQKAADAPPSSPPLH